MSRAPGRCVVALLGSAILTVALLGWPAGTALVVTHALVNPDAIISLASNEWERLPHTAELAAASPGAVVLLTQPVEVTRWNCDDCPHRIEWLRDLGVAEARVRMLPILVDGTHGEAVAALTFWREHGFRSLLVSTSPYHARRSLATFRTVFAGTPVDIGVDPASSTSPAQPARWWWAHYDRRYVVYEWEATAYYWWRYGVPAWSRRPV